MILPEMFIEELMSSGIDFFAGVPDSLLKDLCACMDATVPAEGHVITANEGNAIALALGRYLGTGRPSVVYMQNSGLGNAVNPLLSLADPAVYAVPMLLVIGWRGEPGVKDEPQHVKQGAVSEAMLESMDVPYWVIGPDSDAKAVLVEAIRAMHERSGPVALLVRSGSFSAFRKESPAPTEGLGREEAIGLVLERLDAADTVVSTTGHISRELYEHRVRRSEGHANDFLTVGGMGHTSSIALGMALGRPDQQLVCIDGDGSVLMHQGMLAVIGSLAPQNLIHVVLNNGAHESVGGQPTVGLECDFKGIASSAGYRSSVSVTTEAELSEAMDRARRNGGPSFIEIRVRRGAREDLGRPKTSPRENKIALMKRLGSG